MALAEATHHAAPRGPQTARAQEEVERETYNVPRHQNTPPLGTRPGLPSEPERQWVDAALSHRAAGVPSLETLPVRAWEGLDSSTVRFLAKKWKEEEEEKERVQRERQRAEFDVVVRQTQERMREVLKRKRKKRKKRRLGSSTEISH